MKKNLFKYVKGSSNTLKNPWYCLNSPNQMENNNFIYYFKSLNEFAFGGKNLFV